MSASPDSGPALWHPFEGGRTTGKHGTEGGLIRRDEEHIAGARITLEEGAMSGAFAVTCGVYGIFMHTAFAGDMTEGLAKYLAMQRRLEEIITLPDREVPTQVRAFVAAF